MASSRNCRLWIEPTNYITETRTIWDCLQSCCLQTRKWLRVFVEPETIPLPVLDTEEVTKKYSSAEFLINVLLNEPQKSEYFRDKTRKGLRNNYIYTVDITQRTLQDINADDNGAHKQIRNTLTVVYWKGDKVHTVYRNSEELHYDRKISFNKYEKSLFPIKRLLLCIDDTAKQRVFPWSEL